MPLLNYTTKIAPEQTIAEIQKILIKHDVTGFMTEFDGPQVSSVAFRISLNGEQVGFRLPCNWRAIAEMFHGDRKHYSRVPAKDFNAQAERTAWRIVKDWVEAQCALVEVNMVTIPQVFLPYAITKTGETLGERMITNPQFLLGNGKQ